MKIYISSIHVDDQARAHDFYTGVLGFTVKHDIPVGGGLRWLTVVSPQDPTGAELGLEPDDYPAVKALKESLVADGIPATSLLVDDIEAETKRLKEAGVVFTQEPLEQGNIVTAVFDDTCGNLIQICEVR